MDGVGDDWTPDTGVEPIEVAKGVVVIVSVAAYGLLIGSVGETGDKVAGNVRVIVEVAVFEGIMEIGVYNGTVVFPGVVPGCGVFEIVGIGVAAGVFVAGGIVGMDCNSEFAQVVPVGIKTRIEIRIIISDPIIFIHRGDFINSSNQETGKQR